MGDVSRLVGQLFPSSVSGCVAVLGNGSRVPDVGGGGRPKEVVLVLVLVLVLMLMLMLMLVVMLMLEQMMLLSTLLRRLQHATGSDSE
jgi:hypothetical protein